MRDVNREVGSLDRGDSSDETKILLLIFDQPVEAQINAVMDRAQMGQGFLPALRVADADILHVGIPGVVLTQIILVWTVQSQNEWAIHKGRKREPLRRLHMNDIAVLQRVSNRPGCVIQLPYPRALGLFDGPERPLIQPAPFCLHRRFPVGVDHCINAGLAETLRKLTDEKLSSPILCRWHRDKRRGNKGNPQLPDLTRFHARKTNRERRAPLGCKKADL